jgi:hypothetical protein
VVGAARDPKPLGLLNPQGGIPICEVSPADARMRTAHQLGQGLLALFDRQPAQVSAVKFEQVEGAERGGVVVTKGAEAARRSWEFTTNVYADGIDFRPSFGID